MKGKHRHADCIRCGDKDKYIKARGLCESCYMKVKATGELERWPTLRSRGPGSRTRILSGCCGCYSPIPQYLGEWQDWQCLKCGKKLLHG